jgi:membrane dipeptidase
MANPRRRWFDAHLDLAMLAALGRDMEGAAERQDRPFPPCAVTLRSLAEARITHVLATIFVEPDGDDAPIAYRLGDAEGAAQRAMAQAEIYEDWFRRGLARPMVGGPADGCDANGSALCLGVLLEGADPLATPESLSDWVERLPVLAVGMAWVHAGRYAGGNATQEGLTPLGRLLMAEIERHALAHDVSHLSDRALDELLDLAGASARVIASHSNCRALLGESATQRHLTDRQIRRIAARDGVIGLNLYSRFLSPRCEQEGRATIAEALAHVDRICQVAGSTAHVGMGSDADGGFSAARLPEFLHQLSDVERLAEGLRAAPYHWSDGAIDAFAFENWARVFRVRERPGCADAPIHHE